MRIYRFFAAAYLKVELRQTDAAGTADGGNFFATGNFLPFFYQQLFIMRISRNPTIVMFYQNQVAKAFQLVSGIGHRSAVRRLDGRAAGSFDIDTVVIAPFADGTE